MSIHCSLTMRWWIQVASMENSRCPEGSDRNSSTRGRARSSRTGCSFRDSPLWVERRQDLPTEPDLDPSRMAGVDGPRQQRVGRHSFVRRAQECPEPRARGSGAAPHGRTCAPARRRGRLIRFGGPGMQPPRALFLGGTQRAFPSTPMGGDRHAIAAGRSLPLGSIALRTIPDRLSRSVQLAAKRAGMRIGGLLLPPAPRSRTSGGRDHLDEIRLGSYRGLISRSLEDHGEC
jgi:hypothetical protein